MAKLTREDVERIVRETRGRGEILDLSSMDLVEVSLNGMNLRGANLQGADLRGADLCGVNLRGADLSEADFTGTDLSEAYLRGAYLRGANLSGTNINDTDLSKTDLVKVDFSGANLSRANLSEANLSVANLNTANLEGAFLNGANLRGANLNGTNLSQADLSETKVWQTAFGNVDLSGVKGLQSIEHDGPSIIGIDTIYHSKGQIPEVFLRGAGVPDNFITYATALVGEAIQYYSCFISYSSQDEAFAQRLHSDLQQKGVRCWFAPEDMKIGDKIRPTIDQSIRVHDKLLIILSENSLNSEWVETEMETAFAEERKRKQTALFPVRLDNAIMETALAWATHIRDTRHIGDFSRWKNHDAYQKAFERLLRDLKAEG